MSRIDRMASENSEVLARRFKELPQMSIQQRARPASVKVGDPTVNKRKINKKEYFMELERKLMVDLDRSFPGQSEEQRDALIKIIDRNADLRKIAGLPPGLYENIKTLAIAGFDADGQDVDTENFLFSGKYSSMAQKLGESEYALDNSGDFYKSEYPILEHTLRGTSSEDQLKVVKTPPQPLTETQILQKKYAKFIKRDAKVASNSLADMEAAALQKMKKVSSDLQSWVTEKLDKSIPLNPEILEQVRLLDSKATHQLASKPPIEQVDITGFNVLLNACKPAMLEARPPMKLNVVRDANRNENINHIPAKPVLKNPRVDEKLKANLQKRLHFGNWYLDCEEWASHEKNEKAEETHIFGGIVQQKLQDIAKKRAIEMEVFLKEVKEMERAKKNIPSNK